MMINWTGDWVDDLIWCPSQLTREFNFSDEDYVLYCRWRWDDPWGFYFYKKEGKLSDFDIFLGFGLTQEDTMDTVHAHAEKLLYDYLKNLRD